MVMVIAGREQGKTGKVLRVLPDSGKATVERLNIVKRHSKPRGAASPGGIVEKEAPLDISNLMFFCERLQRSGQGRLQNRGRSQQDAGMPQMSRNVR